MKQVLEKLFILSLFLWPIVPLEVCAEPGGMIVDAPDDTYSGIYVYQGARNSTSNCDYVNGTVQTRAYYRLEGTNYYLYADYMNHVCWFPDWFDWYICDGLIDSPALDECIYFGHEYTGLLGPEGCTKWYKNNNGGEQDVTSQMSVLDQAAMTVTTLPTTLVTATTGEVGGSVANNNSAITARGLVYSLSDTTPEIGEAGVTQVPKGSGPGTYFDVFSSLTPGVTYYYQAYGTNAWVTKYGGVRSFTTHVTGPPNKLVSGIANPTWANGVYLWIGDYTGKPAWKHQVQNYWVYYSYFKPALPNNLAWYIDNELKNDHSAYDYTCMYPADVPTCPVSGWSDSGGGTVTIVDYPQIDVTSGVAFNPGYPAAGTNNNPIGRFFLKADIAGAHVTAATISVGGAHTGVTSLKLWSSADATFDPASDTLLSSQPNGATVTFSGFSSSILTSGTYYFITADLDVTGGGALALTIGSQANLTISGGAIVYGFSSAALTDGGLTILPVAAISISDVTVSENAGSAVFMIALSQTYSSDITVHYATADTTATAADSDYTSTSGTATIAAGTLSTTVSVPIINDSYYETDETFYVNLSSASAGFIADAQGVGTITNDDSQPSVTLGLSGSPLAENGGVATVTATLSNRSYQDVTVNLGYSGTATGTDYTAAASITITAGSLSNAATITGVNDSLDEGDETVIVDITGVMNGIESGVQQVTAIIADDDIGISVNDVSAGENAGNAVFINIDTLYLILTVNIRKTIRDGQYFAGTVQ